MVQHVGVKWNCSPSSIALAAVGLHCEEQNKSMRTDRHTTALTTPQQGRATACFLDVDSTKTEKDHSEP